MVTNEEKAATEAKARAALTAPTQAEAEAERVKVAQTYAERKLEAEIALHNGTETAAVKRMRESGVLEDGYTRDGAAIFKTPE